MVFRGKPSKACGRCRLRRLKCDLCNPCGQCGRAKVSCSGYRDTQELRIRNESYSVIRKALKNTPHSSLSPRSLPLSIDLQARDAFFAYYVTSTSKTWDFLKQYYHPVDSPDHLSLAIEAVSLAYLWYQVNSDTALATARERYISALRQTNLSLQLPNRVSKITTLLASLLLDLFEKITYRKPRNNKSWTSHVTGALSLVRVRGLEKFQDPEDLRVLLRLSTNHLISCVASGSRVSEELVLIRAYIEKHLQNSQDPKWRLSNLMVHYANLRHGIKTGVLSLEERVLLSQELDRKLEALDNDMPPAWQPTTTFLKPNPKQKSEQVFGLYYDTYADRNVTQPRNVLRFVRILLNEDLISYYSASTNTSLSPLTPNNNSSSSSLSVSSEIKTAQSTIAKSAAEICASVPQYVDCSIFTTNQTHLSTTTPSQHSHLHLPPSSQTPPQPPSPHSSNSDRPNPDTHPHTPPQNLSTYTLLFPLFIVGRSFSPSKSTTLTTSELEIRQWVINQLRYIGQHFGIKNAEVLAGMLEDESGWQGSRRGKEGEVEVEDVWEVYGFLGSYAFAA